MWIPFFVLFCFSKVDFVLVLMHLKAFILRLLNINFLIVVFERFRRLAILLWERWNPGLSSCNAARSFTSSTIWSVIFGCPPVPCFLFHCSPAFFSICLITWFENCPGSPFTIWAPLQPFSRKRVQITTLSVIDSTIIITLHKITLTTFAVKND